MSVQIENLITDMLDKVRSGQSMSSVAKECGVSLSTVSKYCKMHDVKSIKETPPKELPFDVIKEEYLTGVSWYKLSKKYKIAPHNLKKRMLLAYPDIESRTIDQAIRPSILNDEKQLTEALKKQSICSLSRSLGVKIATVSSAIKRLGMQKIDIEFKEGTIDAEDELTLPPHINEMDDNDIYYAKDWRLLFDNNEDLTKWLLKYGFKPLKWPETKLSTHASVSVPEREMLNANYQNQGMVDFIRHFSDHYWYSSRKDYNSVNKPFELGNTSVLRDAMQVLWHKKKCDIYSLVRFINKQYKNFMLPSIFKPWVAEYVYNRHLANGDTVYDPCMGWGGRLIGTKKMNIRYIGSDLNKNSVNSNSDINDFLRNSLHEDNQFFQADASTVTRDQLPEKVDAIFTSPPYDDTEHYHGFEKQCSDTSQIYKNLFGLGIRKVIFNIPWRHSDNVKKIATDCGYKLFDTIEMKTSAPIRRSKMSEPIHVFLK